MPPRRLICEGPPVHPAALDRPLTLQLESEFDEELDCGREVVNHDADVLHPLDRHVLNGQESRFEPRRQAPEKPRPRLHLDYRSSDFLIKASSLPGTPPDAVKATVKAT
jgi:hypothetical protein